MTRPHAAPPDDVRMSRLRIGVVDLIVVSWSRGDADPMTLLTPAEQEVAGLLLAGCSRGRVAKLRGTAPGTVDKQIERIYDRLGVSSRTELTRALAILPALWHGEE